MGRFICLIFQCDFIDLCTNDMKTFFFLGPSVTLRLEVIIVGGGLAKNFSFEFKVQMRVIKLGFTSFSSISVGFQNAYFTISIILNQG